MWSQLSPGLRINIFLTILPGVIYPLAITGICQVVFPHQANGSLITQGDKVVGSELIGQNFTKPEYFQPRPSAAGNDGYDATASGGSNYGPTNQKLIDRVKASVDKFRKENPDYHGPIPADLLTASASGLDPDISPGLGARAGPARRQSARHLRGSTGPAGGSVHPAAGSRASRRAARQRAEAEPGAGPAIPAQAGEPD